MINLVNFNGKIAKIGDLEDCINLAKELSHKALAVHKEYILSRDGDIQTNQSFFRNGKIMYRESAIITKEEIDLIQEQTRPSY